MDSSKNGGSVFQGDALDGNLGFGDDEIMVEIVGSDVFVDGVKGNEMSADCGVIGDLGLREGGVGTGIGGFEGNVGGGDFVEEEVGVEDYGVIEDVMFLERLDGCDEVAGSGDMCCGNGDGLVGRDVVMGSGDMCCGNGDGLERRDEVMGSGDVHGDVMNCDTKVVEEDVKVVVDEDSEKCEEVTERDVVSCGMAALSASEDIDVHGYVISCASEVVKEDVKVAANEGALGGEENVIERVVVSCELVTASTQEDSGMPGEAVNGADEVRAEETLAVTESSSVNNHVAKKLDSVAKKDGTEAVKTSGEVLENQTTPEIGVLGDEASDAHVLDDVASSDKSIETAKRTGLIKGVSEEDVKVVVSESGLERGEEVTVRDDVSCVLATPSACEDSDMHGNALNSDTKVAEEDVKVVANEDPRNCEEVTVRNGGSCILTVISACNDTDIQVDTMTCASEVVEEDPKIAPAENAFGRVGNVIEREEVSCGLATTSVHELSDVHGVAVNGADEVGEGDKIVVTVSFNGDTSDVAERLASVANEVSAEEAAIPLGEVLENQMMLEIGLSGNEASDAHVLDDMDTSDKSVETAKRIGMIEGDCHIDEGTQSSTDLVSTNEHSEIVAGFTEAIDSKALNPDRDVKSEEHKILTTESVGMSVENTDCAGENELKVEASCGSFKSDIVLCSDPESVGKQILADRKLILNDNLVANPLANINRCETICPDTGKKVEQVKIPETDVSGVSFKEAIYSKDNGSVADASNHTLSSFSERVTVDNTSEIDVAICTYPVSSSQENHDTDEATVMSIDIADSNMEVSTTDMDVISSSKDIRGVKCDPSKKDGNIPMNEENFDKQAVDYIGSNAQDTDGDFDLPIPECLDATSDQDRILEVEEEYNDENKVDIRKLQEADVQDKAMDIEQSDDFGEKSAEQVSLRSASSISEFHSRYLLPPDNEGEFSVGDLVWSKDRSLPWWPGQISNPADASEKTLKYHKNDCFLVSYFGMRTFAWNDKSRIRPFRTHSALIEKKYNSEAYHQAVNCALVEVSRRVQLGLACSCKPKTSFVEIESQIVENIGIHQEVGRRFHVDESTAASCFEPVELLEHIRSLALIPSSGCDGRLQLTVSKAQVAAFSRFKGHHFLPEFHLCGGLLENDANTLRLGDVIQEHNEQVKGENDSSSKRKRELADGLPPRKKDRSMSGLIADMPQSDGEEERDSDIRDSSVTSSAARKRKALLSITDGSSKRQIYYAAKVSTTASQTPKKSFKVGECILRVASQLTGTSSVVKCDRGKFLETDDSVDQHHGFNNFSQTSVNSQQGMMHLSIDEMLSQLHLVAQDPMKRYSFLNEITYFFSGYRQSLMSQNSRRGNQPIGRGRGKKKAPQSIINPPEDFEFNDVNDLYWTDRKVQDCDEEHMHDSLVPNEADKEQVLDRGQNEAAENQPAPNEADKEKILDTAQCGEAKSQLLPSEADKPIKSGRRSLKRLPSRKQVMVAEEPVVEHLDIRRPDCSPTQLLLKFTEGKFVPSELNLNKIFRRFGPLRESETEINRENSSAKVVYKRFSDAKVALSSAGSFNIFGPMLVSYELSSLQSAPFKTSPAATVQNQEDAS